MEPISRSGTPDSTAHLLGSTPTSPRASISRDTTGQPISPQGPHRPRVDTPATPTQRTHLGLRIEEIFSNELKTLTKADEAPTTWREQVQGGIAVIPGVAAMAYGVAGFSLGWAALGGTTAALGLSFPSYASEKRVMAAGSEAIERQVLRLAPQADGRANTFMSQFLDCARQSADFRDRFTRLVIQYPDPLHQAGAHVWQGLLDAAQPAALPQGMPATAGDRALLIEQLGEARDAALERGAAPNP